MAPRKRLQLAYGLVFVLFFIAVVGYAGFSVETPDPPLRMMYSTNAGKVLFDHRSHSAPRGYALACDDCHHHSGTEEIRACGDCHGGPEQQQEVKAETHDLGHDAAAIPARSDAFHDQCIGCHRQYGAGPEACNACHVL